MTHALFWLSALSALIYLPMTTRAASRRRSLAKTASVALLALVAALAGGPVLLILALALCALGDALLARETDAGFQAGIGAFALGHMAYAALFLTHPGADTARIAAAWPTVAGLAALGLGMTALLAPRAGDLKAPVLAYIPIILGMGVAVLALPQAGAMIWAWPAALAFICSDLILATETFLLSAGHPARRVTPYLVWPLYWGAQAGLLVALA